MATRRRPTGLPVSRLGGHERSKMSEEIDQAILHFVDLRLRLRGNVAACEIVDRCLRLLTEAKTADAETFGRLEEEMSRLRADLETRFGPKRPLSVH